MPTDLGPRKHPRQERSRQTVERILDAAAHIFGELGYRAATTNDIAARAGISIGSLYQYFPNKDALLVALADRHVEEVSAVLDVALADAAARRPSLDQLATELIGLVVHLHESDRLHLLLAHEAPRTPELAQRLRVLFDRISTAVADHLERATPAMVDPLLTAALLVAMVDAAVHDVVIARPTAQDRRAAMTRTIELIMRAIAPAA